MVHHGDTEGTEALEVVSGQIIGAAVEVHRAFGPGLLESSYQACMSHELALRGLRHVQQKELPLRYKGVRLSTNYRIDFLVDDLIVVEVKAVEALQPIHTAQLLTYLKILDLRFGLLINFNVQTLIHGVRRVLNGY
jgi:GxxExxY protein